MMPGWSAVPAPPGLNQASNLSTYAYPTNPAYTPVAVRQGFQTFGSSTTAPYNTFGQYQQTIAQPFPPSNAVSAPTPASPEQPKGKIEWPESVRNYVQRSFMPQNDDPTVPRAAIEAKLKETIGKAKEKGTLHTIDWNSMPLPQALVKIERENESKHSIVSPSASSSWSPKTKKRKSSEFASSDNVATPRQATNPIPLEDRISAPAPSKFQKDANKRKRRFENEYKAAHKSPSPPPPSAGPIVGTSETLEKRYLRLTAPPVPSNVRPESVLRQTLDLLKKKWRIDANYSYICDQFKSMRQDLTVQRIKNNFTVSVYEIHARIALEKGDIGEYNQCQTQLRSLYALGLKGNPIEFKAYRILYFIHTANRTGLNDTLADLTPAEKEERPIKHALNVRSSLALGNYHRFFQLYLDTPNMGAYLMDMFVLRERLAAMCNICKGYKPDVKLRFITEELGFESDVDAAQFIMNQQGQHLLEERTDCITFLAGKAGSLFESARSVAFQKVDIKGQI